MAAQKQMRKVMITSWFATIDIMLLIKQAIPYLAQASKRKNTQRTIFLDSKTPHTRYL